MTDTERLAYYKIARLVYWHLMAQTVLMFVGIFVLTWIWR